MHAAFFYSENYKILEQEDDFQTQALTQNSKMNIRHINCDLFNKLLVNYFLYN